MDQKLPAKTTGGDNRKKPPSQQGEQDSQEDGDLLEKYREHFRAAVDERPNRTIHDKMRIVHEAMSRTNGTFETDTQQEEADIDWSARQLYQLHQAFGRPKNFKFMKRGSSPKKPPPTASSIISDVERFRRQMAELEDPTIPDHHPFKIGDDVKIKFANTNTLKISVRSFKCRIVDVNDDGTVDIFVCAGPVGIDSYVERNVNPRTLQAYKRRKPRSSSGGR